jgi:anti-sigma regulatory factor (Ser/Thr protein kinase)
MAGDVRDPRLIIHVVADRREISIHVIDDGPGVGDPENTLRPFISPKERHGHRLGLC